MKIVATFILLSVLVLFSACSHAYSSHHGNRGARYNNLPYNGVYQYSTYRQNTMHMGRPYRRY